MYTILKWANSCTNITNSQLTATFKKYFKLLADVQPHNTRQFKTRQLVSPKARSHSGAKMIKNSAIAIQSRIASAIKNKTCLALFSAEYRKYVLLGY